MKRIIGLTGYAGSGKDFVADLLVKHHGFTQYAIADELKRIVSRQYTMPIALMQTQEGKQTVWKDGKTVRQLMNEVATECKKNWGDDVFIQKLLDRIEFEDYTLPEQVVISDVRYPCEQHILQLFADEYRRSFELWRIVRMGVNAATVGDDGVDTLVATQTVINSTTGTDALEQQISALLVETVT